MLAILIIIIIVIILLKSFIIIIKFEAKLDAMRVLGYW